MLWLCGNNGANPLQVRPAKVRGFSRFSFDLEKKSIFSHNYDCDITNS